MKTDVNFHAHVTVWLSIPVINPISFSMLSYLDYDKEM